MKHSYLTPCFLIAVFLCLAQIGHAQCNATFTVGQTNGTDFVCQANQTELPGYSYTQFWKEDGYEDPYNYTSIEVFNFYYSGDHIVCHYMTIQDSMGITLCTDSSCQTLHVILQPTCTGLTEIFDSHDTGKTVTFSSNISSYTHLQLIWNFGDGTSQTGVASPTHTYAQYGEYEYSLRAIDTVQHCADSTYGVAFVDSFYYDTCNLFTETRGYQPLLTSPTYNFIENLIFNNGGPLIHIWNFGDGSAVVTTTADSITHTYPHYGEYSMIVIDSNIINHCTNIGSLDIDIVGCSPGFAQYETSANQNVPYGAYFFSDSSQAYNYPYSQYFTPTVVWSFGDGTSDTTYYDYYNDEHVYPGAGTYNTCFYFTGPGCSTYSSCKPVTVGCNLDATFTYNVVTSNSISFSPNMLLYNDYYIDTNATFLWVFGDSAISTETYPTHVFNNAANLSTCLIVTDTLYGCSDTFCTDLSLSPYSDTVCGTVFLDLNGNGIQDSLEPALPNVTVYCMAFSDSLYQSIPFIMQTDSNGYYMCIVPQSFFMPLEIYLNAQDSWLFSVPGYYTYSNTYLYDYGGPGYYDYYFMQDQQHQCGFDFGVISEYSLISGTVYADNNNNGTFDAGDAGIGNQIVDMGNQSVMTFNDGSYYAYVDQGTYLVRKDSSGFFANAAVLPPSYNLNIPASTVMDTSVNFGLQLPSGIHDLALDLIPVSPVTPDMESYYYMHVTNLTGSPETFSDSLTADSSLSFDPTYTYSATINHGTNTANWHSNYVQAFGTSDRFVGCVSSASQVYNQDIYDYAGLTLAGNADADPTNNADTCHQIVVASFDPNNKQANQAGRGALGYIRTSQVLKYNIEFQNTGTADAINITVRDIIDPGFDMHTFRYITSSYGACDVKIAGDTVYFRFMNIMLPPEIYDTLSSIGWVDFSIEPKSNLAPLTALQNTAAVFFDHNQPVYTNTTLHTIEDLTGVINNGYDDGQLTIAPNPFTEQTYFRLQNMPDAGYNYMVTDVLGRTIVKGIIKTGETHRLKRNAMSVGTYMLIIYDDNGIVKSARIEVQ